MLLVMSLLLLNTVLFPVVAPGTEDRWDPLIAGIRISTIIQLNRELCSIGYPALMFKPPADYISVFVTAAHCTSNVGQTVFQPNVPRGVGTVYSRFVYYDVAFVELEVGETINSEVWYSYTSTREIRGYHSASELLDMSGDTVYLIGATSGRVQSVLMGYIFDNNNLVGIAISRAAQPGDSGGFVGTYFPPSWRKPSYFKLIGIVIAITNSYDLVMIADFFKTQYGIIPEV